MGDPNDPDYAEVCQRCDTSLTTEDGTVFRVNSELLSRHSKFFKSLFLMGEEAGQSTVIRDIKPDIFQIILTYMNTGEILLTTENILDLLVASDFLMIETLLDECKKFVLQDKRADNLVSYFIIANRIKGLHLEDHCRRFLVLCFEKAVMHSMYEACRLPYGDLKYFLSHRSLNVSDERTVWSVIEAYIQREPLINQSIVPELLRCLSVHEISEELASDILSSPVIRNNMVYRNAGDHTFDFLSDVVKAQSRNRPPDISGVRLPRFLHVVAKLSGDGDAELHVSYDDSLDLWRKVGEVRLRSARILVSGHLVYYLNRVSNGRHEFSGLYYDLLRNEQRRMALPYFEGRLEGYLVGEVGRGRVFALGTYDNAVKRYVHEANEWKDMKRVRRMGSLAGALLNVDDTLYVLGDVGGSSRMFMRVYDYCRDKWGRVPSPTVWRSHAESAVFQGKIFVVGGQINPHFRASDYYVDVDVDDDDDDDDEDGDEDYDDVRTEYDFNEEIVERNYFAGEDFAAGHVALGNAVNNAINDREEDEPDQDDLNVMNDLERNRDEVGDQGDGNIDAIFAALARNHMAMVNPARPWQAMVNIQQDVLISKAVEVYDPKTKEWTIYPELPFRFSPVFMSVVKDRLYVYQSPQRPVTYWDGSGQWKIEENPSKLFQHKFGVIKDDYVLTEIMIRNREEDPTVWLETGLEKVVP